MKAALRAFEFQKTHFLWNSSKDITRRRRLSFSLVLLVTDTTLFILTSSTSRVTFNRNVPSLKPSPKTGNRLVLVDFTLSDNVFIKLSYFYTVNTVSKYFTS